jgi:hypothetical protein
MTEPNNSRPPSQQDWILLPLICVFTIVGLAVSTESAARQYFGTSSTSLSSCLVLDDPAHGIRGLPNSVCHEKVPESDLVEYKFDCLGYRVGIECQPRPQGIYRIVMVGSSMAMGENVPIQQTFAALLPQELSRRTGRNIELYNYAMAFGFPRNVVLRFDDVLAAKPDLILWVWTPLDIKLASYLHANSESSATMSSPSSIGDLVKSTIRAGMHEVGGNPLRATATALTHFLYKYKAPKQYIRSYLDIPPGGEGMWDAGPDALKAQLSPEWKAHLTEAQNAAAVVWERAALAGVPIGVTMLPNRAQAAMLSLGDWPEGYDPFVLSDNLRSITTKLGGYYVDILPNFRAIPRMEQYYYPIDGHPDSAAHAIIATMLTEELTNGTIPALKAGHTRKAGE